MSIVYIGPAAVLAQGQVIAILLVNVTSSFSSATTNKGIDYAALECTSCIIGRSPQLVVPGCAVLQCYSRSTIDVMHYASPRRFGICQTKVKNIARPSRS